MTYSLEKYMKSKFLIIALGYLLVGNAIGQERPNIVWIVSEDNSPLLGCYGDSVAYTPHLDSLAARSVLFEQAYANAPVCAPSRATLISGMHATSLGAEHMRSSVSPPEGVQFFPKYLREAGYYTALRFKRDYNMPAQEGTWDKDDFWHLEDALSGRENNQPFFIMYNTWMTHEGELHKAKDDVGYFQNTFEREPDADHRLASIPFIGGADVEVPAYHPQLDELVADWAHYYRAVARMDHEVGYVLQQLSAKGLLENTVVFYFSDHGGALSRGKRFVYDDGLKVPLIIHFPESMGITQGKRIDTPVSFVDLAPTVLDLAGVEPPAYMQGSSIVEKMNRNVSKNVLGYRGRMDEAIDMSRTLRSKDYRYIYNYMPYRPMGQHIEFLWKAPGMQAWAAAHHRGELAPVTNQFFAQRASEELYDVRKDPHMVNNRALDPVHKKTLKQFRKDLINRLKSIDDQGVVPEGMRWLIANGHLPAPGRAALGRIHDLAIALTRSPSWKGLLPYLERSDKLEQYWALQGALQLLHGGEACPASVTQSVRKLAADTSSDVGVAAAEALLLLGEKEEALATFSKFLKGNNANKATKLAALNALIANRAYNETIVYLARRYMNGTLETNEYLTKASSYLVKEVVGLNTRFFSDSSFWNQLIPADAKTDVRSEQWIGLLKQDKSGENFGLNVGQYTIPVYEVDSLTPVYEVSERLMTIKDQQVIGFGGGWFEPGEVFHHAPGFGQQVPIPDKATPDPESDAHFSVVDYHQRMAWDMWGAKKDGSGWSSFTGIQYSLDGSGTFHDRQFELQDDESVHAYGPGRASGVPIIAGTIMYDEVMAGEIHHKLSCAVRYAALKAFVYPAIWTDGVFEGGLPEGAVIRLDPDLDLSQFDLLPGELVVAKAMQTYGMVIVDVSLGNVLYPEGLWEHPYKSWKGVLRGWDEPGGIKSIPLDHYQVLEVGEPIPKGDNARPEFDKVFR